VARRKPANNKPEETPACVVEQVPQVDAILTGDIHLRDDQPVCRTDNFFEAQAKKMAWLAALQKQYQCPIIDSGDVFGKARPSPYLLQWAIRNMPDRYHSVPGNHDLPEHSLANIDKSGFGVLCAAETISNMTGICAVNFGPRALTPGLCVGVPWGIDWFDVIREHDFYEIAVIHIMTYHGNTPWPGCTDPDADTLLKDIPARLVVTGHNHVPFVVQGDDKILVNPGSLMRSTAAQADFKPRVYLYCAHDNTVQPVYVPIEAGVVSREHLDSTRDKEERLSEFVSRLAEDVEVGLSFQANMEKYLSDNRVRKGVRRIIEKGMEL
jgi:predicted phosphodiesterase